MIFSSLPPALEERTLLLELNHRINNEFASVINLVSVAAVRADNSEVKAALSDVVFPLTEREQPANPARARRPFGRTRARQMKTVPPPVVVTADPISYVR
jgi:hypothetical protein